jgi:hypothetical protein
MPNVQWKSPDDGQRNCLKQVEFLDKNKFENLVGFIKKKFVTMHGHMNVNLMGHSEGIVDDIFNVSFSLSIRVLTCH